MGTHLLDGEVGPLETGHESREVCMPAFWPESASGIAFLEVGVIQPEHDPEDDSTINPHSYRHFTLFMACLCCDTCN